MNEKSFRTLFARSSNDVLAFYDRYASTWDNRFMNKKSTDKFHQIRLNSFLSLAKLSKNSRIIEVGVGTGVYLDKISPIVKEVICIDGSNKMLDELEKKHGALSNIKLIQLDLEKPVSKDIQQADLVYCFGLIEHIIEIDTFIQNLGKMINHKGRLIFVTPNGKSPWYGNMRYLLRSGKHCSTDKYYNIADLNKLMSKHGFIEEKCIYWGYFPAGVNDFIWKLLEAIGYMIDKTPMRKYAGGITISYMKNKLTMS
jgi:2-polyprenyl-3-methyl-5-hydroxy-6-metoxy-1,4-benzoquinol methylase